MNPNDPNDDPLIFDVTNKGSKVINYPPKYISIYRTDWQKMFLGGESYGLWLFCDF